jgi:hypothetical protein
MRQKLERKKKKTRREGTLHCQKERAAQQDVETEDDEKRIQDNYGQDEQKRQGEAQKGDNK